MIGVNKTILVSTLGRDPETRYTPAGDPVCNISVATSEKYKDKQGQPVEKTEWHRVVIFGKLAEIADMYLKKGSKVYLEGKNVTRKWQDNGGQDRYTTEIVVDSYRGVMQMLDSRSDSEPQGQQRQPQQQAQQSSQGMGSQIVEDFDDDIPFDLVRAIF